MAANKEVDNSLSAETLISKYSWLNVTNVRENVQLYVSDHIYQIFDVHHENMGYTPFSDEVFQSFTNLLKDKEQTKNAAKPVKVQKYKVDEKDPKKKIKLEGEFDMKEKRLRKITTFNAQGKSALTFIATAFAHEAATIGDKINKSSTDEIKNAIKENATTTCAYAISPLLFAICEFYSDEILTTHFNKTHGNLKSKLETAIDKIITKNGDVRNIVVGTLMKFLQLFTVDMASRLWWETKESEDENSKETTYTGKGTTTSDKQVKQYLMSQSNFLMPEEERLNGDFFDAMNSYHRAFVIADDERKAENKKQKAEKAKQKKDNDKDKTSKVKDASNSDDDGDESEKEGEDDDGEGEKTPPAKKAPVKAKAAAKAKTIPVKDEPVKEEKAKEETPKKKGKAAAEKKEKEKEPEPESIPVTAATEAPAARRRRQPK